MGTTRLEGVAELEAVLLEREDVELLVVEIAVQFAAVPRETALMEVTPYWCHHMDDLHFVEMVIDNRSQVFVDAEYGDGIQVGQHIIDHVVLLTLWEGVAVECLDFTLLKPFHRYHQHLRIDEDLSTSDVLGQDVHCLKGLPQVGSHRHTALHHIRLIDDRLLQVRCVCHRERQGVLSYSYRQSSHHFIPDVTLAMQTASSPAAITAKKMLTILLEIFISGAKLQ